MASKKWIAMLLAGGQGTRLGELTKSLAKPAVAFGGKYRIIDFALSNCTHSGIDTVGVLTQYEPHLLNAYVGNGGAWDLDRKFGGVSVLPPYKGFNGGRWYRGTAHAVYQNMQFIDQYDPEYVLVLSGDHVYKMDYSRLLCFHKEKGADATIAVIEVPWHEVHRFGIMNTDDQSRIHDFTEKPKLPESNLASMGVYIFNWKKLKAYLISDANDPTSSNDFGKEIIPKLLADDNRLFAYRFNGYWKDVGTVQSLWEAHMDLLDETSALNLCDPNWKIFAANSNQPTEYISLNAKVSQSLVNEGCMVYGRVLHSVLSQNVYVGKGTIIKDSFIMPHVKIGENVTIERAIISSNITIDDGIKIGASYSNSEITMIGESHRECCVQKKYFSS